MNEQEQVNPESGLTPSQERAVIQTCNKTIRLLQGAAILGGAIAGPWDSAWFIVGIFCAWLFGKSKF